MEERDVRVLDSFLHYREAGSGAPIVFLHGNPTSSYLWRNVIPGLAGRGRCLAPDLIGMGRSGKPDLAYRFVDHARYLDAWFEALGLEGVTLVLHDWGAALGLAWARRHPDRVRGLVVMEGVVREMTWDDLPEGARDLFRQFRTPGIGEKLLMEDNVFVELVLPSGILRPLTSEEMEAYRAPFPDPASRRPVWRWPNELPIDGEPADVVAIVRANTAWLTSTAVPKLLLTFEPGAVLPARQVEWWRAHVPALTVESIGPGVHFVQEDHPTAIAAAVGRWMDACGLGRA